MGLLDTIVAYWPCNGDFVDEVHRLSGTGNKVEWVPTKLMGGAYFNGVDSYALIPNPVYIYLTPPFSYSFWIKAPATNEASTYLNINGDNGISIVREQDTWDTVVTVGGIGNKIVGSQRIDTNEWNHICVSISGSESKLYLNSVDITESCTVSSGVAYDFSALTLGCTSSGVGYTEMSINHIGVWPHMLSTVDISTLYNSATGLSIYRSNSLCLSGPGYWVDLGNSLYLSNNQPFTFMCWVCFNSFTAGDMLLTRSAGVRVGGPYTWLLGTQNGTNFYMYTGSSWRTVAASFSLGIWYHLSYNFTGSYMKCYVNGVYKGESAFTFSDSTTGRNTQIGGYVTNGDPTASLSDYRFYNRLLSIEEVQTNMNSFPNLGDNTLIGFWPLTDAPLGIIPDLSKSNKGGTLNLAFIERNSSMLKSDNNAWPINITANANGNVSLVLKEVSINFYLKFNGATGSVIFPSPIVLSGAFTIEFWTYYSSAKLSAMPCGGTGLSTSFIFFHSDYVQVALGNDVGRVTWNSVLTNNNVSDRWAHMAITRTGTLLELFIDGQSQGTRTATTTAAFTITNLGKTWSTTYYYNGFLSDFRVWDRVRTQQEIQDNKNNKNMALPATGLIHYYKLNEGFGLPMNFITGQSSAQNTAIWAQEPYSDVVKSSSYNTILYNTYSNSNVYIELNPTPLYTVSEVVVNSGVVNFSPLVSYTSHQLSYISQPYEVEVTFRALSQYTVETTSSLHGSILPANNPTYYEFESPKFLFICDEGYRVSEVIIDGGATGTGFYDYTFNSIVENHTIETFYDLGENIDALVFTVETFTIDTSGLLLVSGTLTKNQNYLNCVPFVTHKDSSISLSQHFFNVYFEDGMVYAKRSATSGSGLLVINVVEFNPSKAKITKGIFSLGSSTLFSNVTVPALILQNTFLIATWEVVSSSTYWTVYNLRTNINNTTTLEFRRYASGGSISGYYYLVECLNNEFSVQHVTGVTAASSGPFNLSTAVDLNKTMLISSYYPTNDNLYAERNTALFYFYNTYQIYMYKLNAAGVIYYNCQAVTFNSYGKAHVYNMGKFAFLSYTYSVSGALPSVLTNKSNILVHNSSNNQGIGASLSADTGTQNTAFYAIELGADKRTFSLNRGGISFAGDVAVQVVDWVGHSAIVSGTASDINSAVVKSIEHITVGLYFASYEKHIYVPLTKAQDYTQCIPFYTVSSSGYASHAACTIDIIEGPLLSICRADNTLYDCQLSIEVVEFYPTAARIEKGAFCNLTANSTTATISGSTGSGVSSLDKAFLQFNYVTHATDNLLPKMIIRGQFTSVSSISFTLGFAVPFAGYYYVVEFLTNDMSVVHNTHNLLRYFENTQNRTAPISCGLPIVSYYADPGNNNVYLDRATILYDHQFPNSSQAYRYNYSGAPFINECLLKSSEHMVVEKFYYEMSSTTTSGVITLPYPVDYNSTMVLSSTQTIFSATNGTSDMTIQPSSFTKLTLDEDGTKIYYRRTPNTLIGEQRNIVYVVDWSKNNLIYEGPFKGSNKGIVNSIEELNLTLSSTYINKGLSKNQRFDYCVPFIEYKCSSNLNLNEKSVIVDIVAPLVSFYRPLFVSSSITIKCTIVEFNPIQVKVSKYYFYLNKTTSTTITINAVNTAKAFIKVCTVGDYTTNYASNFMCRAHFSNSTSVIITRGVASEYIYGILYIIESLGDSFSVAHSLETFTGLTLKLPLLPTYNVLPMVSSYWLENNDYTARCSYAVTTFPRELIFTRYENTNLLYMAVQLITFKTTPMYKMTPLVYDVAATTSSGVVLFDIFSSFDKSRSLLINSVSKDSFLLAASTGHLEANTNVISNILPNGSGIEFSRYSSSTYSIKLTYTVIEFNISEYYFEGTVMEDGMYVDRDVILYRRSTNEIVDRTTSSGAGGFRLESPYSDEHYVVCFDDAPGVSLNALIYDKLLPEPI